MVLLEYLTAQDELVGDGDSQGSAIGIAELERPVGTAELREACRDSRGMSGQSK